MNRFQDLPAADLELLKEHMGAGRYYLLLGSGVSLDSVGDQRPMRSANQLRLDLAKLTEISDSSSLQQGYSLLSEIEVRAEITDHYTCSVAGPTIAGIASRIWRRVYTFNADNAFETAARGILTKSNSDPKIYLAIHNYPDDYADVGPEVKVSVVHLHGFVERAAQGYVFSREEYAKNISRPNSWMLTLSQLLKSEPFIVSGTSLDEMDVTYYLEQRSKNEIRSDLPPSILVEPFPSRLTKKLCEQHGFWLFEGTAEQFMRTLDDVAGASSIAWNAPITDRALKDLTRVHQLQFSATFERVPKFAQPDFGAARFLLGTPLSWGMLASNIDVPRSATTKLRSRITKAVAERQARVFLILEDAGSGKTAIMKRLAVDLAKTHDNVFWYTGRNFVDEDVCAATLESIDGRLFVFVDDFADAQAFVERLLRNISKKDIIFVGAERAYRLPYIETGMADEEFIQANIDLGIDAPESEKLIRSHEAEGISSLGAKSDADVTKNAKEIIGQPVSVAVCRIQNNYRPFDKIVDELLGATNKPHRLAYATAAIARFCYAGGVRRQILMSAVEVKDSHELMGDRTSLPLISTQHGFVIPKRSVVGDRVLSRIVDKDRTTALDLFTGLAVALAPYVNRNEIRLRSPESRLAGRLLDFDQVVKRLINDDAEEFYGRIKEYWSWNSRYWEQLSLLRLDRYMSDMTDDKLLQEAIQHARHAYAIERHPLSLTTLAKVLFTAMTIGVGPNTNLFSEAWELIKESIEIESRWDNIRATAFVVCFSGVLKYVDRGGMLSGEQASAVRDMVATTHARKFKDRRLIDLRDEVSRIVNAS